MYTFIIQFNVKVCNPAKDIQISNIQKTEIFKKKFQIIFCHNRLYNLVKY